MLATPLRISSWTQTACMCVFLYSPTLSFRQVLLMIFRLSVLLPPRLFFRSLSASVITFLRCSSLSPHHCLTRYLLLPVHPQSPLPRLYNLSLHPLLVLFTGVSVLSFHSSPPLSLSLSNPLLSFPLQSPFDFLHTASGSISSAPLPPSSPW